MLEALVQYRARIVRIVEHLSHHHGVEQARHRLCSVEVPFDQLDASADITRLLRQLLASEVKGIAVDVHSGDHDPAAREQHPQDSFAAAHIQHARPTGLLRHPIDPAAKPMAGRAHIDQTKIHLGYVVPL